MTTAAVCRSLTWSSVGREVIMLTGPGGGHLQTGYMSRSPVLQLGMVFENPDRPPTQPPVLVTEKREAGLH